MKEYLKYLGHKVHEPVSQISGIVSSISFDVSGCIQALVRQEPRDGKQGEPYWLDAKNLIIQSKKPVCKVPNYESIPFGNEAGSQMKPVK